MSILDAHLLEALPLHVDGVEVQDPVVTLYGASWSLTVACPWEATIRGTTLTWLDEGIEDAVWGLVGENLVGVEAIGDAVQFSFTGGTLVATPDTDLDPWVLSVPDGFIVGRQV